MWKLSETFPTIYQNIVNHIKDEQICGSRAGNISELYMFWKISSLSGEKIDYSKYTLGDIRHTAERKLNSHPSLWLHSIKYTSKMSNKQEEESYS